MLLFGSFNISRSISEIKVPLEISQLVIFCIIVYVTNKILNPSAHSGSVNKSEPYWTVPCRTMQWKSAIRVGRTSEGWFIVQSADGPRAALTDTLLVPLVNESFRPVQLIHWKDSTHKNHSSIKRTDIIFRCGTSII